MVVRFAAWLYTACMVVWLTGRQYLHVLAVQRSLTVLRPSARHCMMIKYVSVENCSRFFSIVAYRTYMSLYVQKKYVAEEVSLTPGAVITEWLVSLKQFRCKGIPYTGRCRRCPVPIDLHMLRKARRNLFFSIRPSLATLHIYTRELIAPLYHPLLLRSPSL